MCETFLITIGTQVAQGQNDCGRYAAKKQTFRKTWTGNTLL